VDGGHTVDGVDGGHTVDGVDGGHTVRIQYTVVHGKVP
jgi:hypothetical protein